ncbi:MAG: hypothetical protein AB4057_22495, partial [Crocosphaera sp.]
AIMGVLSFFFAVDSNKRATIATLKEQAATVKNLLPVQPLEPLVLAIATTGDNLNSWQVHFPNLPWWDKQIFPEVQSSLYAAIDQVQESNSLSGHQGSVWTVAITPEGNIVSGSDDSTVKVWRGFKVSSLLEVGCERLQFHPVLLSVPLVDMEDEAKSEAETAEIAAKTCLKYGGWNNEEKAEFLVRKSFAIAKETGEIKAANRKLQEAKRLDDKIDIKSLEQELNQLAASALVKEAKEIVSEEKSDNINRDVSMAKQKLNQAKKLDPNLDKKEIAQALIERGVSLAQADKIDQASIAYKTAQEFYPELKIDSESWLTLCFGGTLNKQVNDVLFACENAVKTATDKDGIELAKGVRGIAKALTGNFDDAIKDLEILISNPNILDDELKTKFKQWVETLKKGENPFTDEVLEELKNGG